MYDRTIPGRNRKAPQTHSGKRREPSEVRRWCELEVLYHARHLLAAALDWLLARERAQ
jgi:hypothetical protein